MFALEDMSHAAMADGVNDPVGTQCEFGAPSRQLLYLPGVEKSQRNQALSELGVVDGRQVALR